MAKALLPLAASGLLLAACSHLGDPFSGLSASQVLTLDVIPLPGDKEPILPADGRSSLECRLTIKPESTLYSLSAITVSSSDLWFSLTGSTTGATHSLVVPFAGTQSSFYAIAPRDYQADAKLSVVINNLYTTATIKLREAAPTRIEVAPTRLQATLGTPLSFTTTLLDTLLTSHAISGQLPVQFDAVSPATAPLLPMGRSVAQPNGSATVITTVAMPDTGTFRYRARVLGVRSRLFTIHCH